MKILDKTSRAVFELSLELSASGVQNRDCFWADPVNMWRDWFTPARFIGLVTKKRK